MKRNSNNNNALDETLLIKGGDIHKQVQDYAKSLLIQSNDTKKINLFFLATEIENKIKELTQHDPLQPLNAGIAFPTGLSVNECAAHWSPNPSDNRKMLTESDIVKIDFGVQLNGHILDGAFSYSFSDRYDDLIQVSQDATSCGIKHAGPDAILGEIGADIQEIIENSEVEINGKLCPVKSTVDLCGHQIKQYHIHGGKAVPNIKIDYHERMVIGEQYAIETFPTTGTGRALVKKDYKFNDCSHFMIPNNAIVRQNVPKNQLKTYSMIYDHFGSLAFCNRWLPTEINKTNFEFLCKKHIQCYPPVYDTKGSYVAQTEKSIYIAENGCVILN